MHDDSALLTANNSWSIKQMQSDLRLFSKIAFTFCNIYAVKNVGGDHLVFSKYQAREYDYTSSARALYMCTIILVPGCIFMI